MADSGLNDLFIEFQPMFNWSPHPTPVWGPFFVAVETTLAGAGLPFPNALANVQADPTDQEQAYVLRL